MSDSACYPSLINLFESILQDLPIELRVVYDFFQ
jgi:hypothetical protein